MNILGGPFVITEWGNVEPTEHAGEAGTALWRTRYFGDLRVRMLTLRPGMSYHVADGAEPHRSSTRIGARLFIVD
jgi:hypothetical protein